MLLNTWNIDLTRQVNIIIGAELGKTSLLNKLYNTALNTEVEASNMGTFHVQYIHCDSPIYEGKSEGQSRLISINKAINKMFELDDVYSINSEKLLIIDNIERGLHIDIQRTLINDLLSKGGPNLKIICSTHSPTIYYQGWIDCVIRANE